MKIEAAARLRAGWWSSMSDTAKKAYKKLHPNSKADKGPGSKPDLDELSKAREEHKAAKDAHSKIRDSAGDERSDAEWEKHDKAQDRLRKATKRLKQLGG